MASLWTLNTSGTRVNYKPYGPVGTNWEARSYFRRPNSRSGAVLETSALTIASGAADQGAGETLTVVVRKAGDGTGILIARAQMCEPGCTEISISFIEGTSLNLHVVPETGSSFVRWETAEGVPVENIYLRSAR